MMLPGVLESSTVTFSGISLGPTKTYESNVLFALRYMVDCEVVGASWVEVPRGKYQLAQPGFSKSSCQIEVSLNYRDLINHPAEGAEHKSIDLYIAFSCASPSQQETV